MLLETTLNDRSSVHAKTLIKFNLSFFFKNY